MPGQSRGRKGNLGRLVIKVYRMLLRAPSTRIVLPESFGRETALTAVNRGWEAAA